MTPYEIPNLRFSLVAKEDIAQHALVGVDTTGQAINALAATAVLGAAVDAAKAGQPIAVADGIVMATASAAITAGNYVSGGTLGKATKSTNATNVVALTSATAADELVTVKIN